MPLFALSRASLGYGGAAVVTDASLVIEPGERVAIVGPSGAGKSTLLGALYEQQRGRAALVPQDGALVPQLSVYHNVFMGRLHRHRALYNLVNLVRPFHGPVASVRAILEELELADKLFSPVGELSGGQKQRTAVARALYHGGDVILGDEPVSAVDGVQARGVLAAMRRAAPTLLLIMHDVGLALEIATRVVGMRGGRIVIDRAAGDLPREELDALFR